jgi:predicted metal-dependent HD superfamily phosphohydrolase
MSIIKIELKPALSKEELQWMHNRFDGLCCKLGVSSEDLIRWRQKLFAQYKQPSRYYHNLVHIYNFIKIFDEHQMAIQQPLWFEVAIWWHDAIYDAQRKDNEQKSAQWAVDCWGAYLQDEALAYIKLLINSTEKHLPLEDEGDLYYFLDMDLSVLATESTTYLIYTDYIAKEYQLYYPKLLYKIGRKKAMKQFFNRSRLYYTSFFYENYEEQAKNNIKLELKTI